MIKEVLRSTTTTRGFSDSQRLRTLVQSSILVKLKLLFSFQPLELALGKVIHVELLGTLDVIFIPTFDNKQRTQTF